jgi:zinc protease
MKRSAPDYPALVIADAMLGSGRFMGNRIAKRLRENEGISYGSGASINVPLTVDAASWGSYAFYNPTKKDAVNAALKDEISKVLSEGFGEEEMKNAIVSWKNARSTSLGNDNTLTSLINLYLFFGVPLDDFTDLEKKIEALKLSDVNQVIKKYISLDKLIMINAGDFNKK